jgi:hypothetical protein
MSTLVLKLAVELEEPNEDINFGLHVTAPLRKASML